MEVIHDKVNNRFVINIDGLDSFVEYSLNEKEMNLYHTYTPPQLRGKGLAEKVVLSAIEYAKENSLKVIPSCSYVAVFMQRHPEYSELLK
ncbi:Putative acetyltransferase [Ignavibacterium album JCM 16511]|uniref:Putative acetyltransferase n=1 Tax=Ignavibacterium album (strain DSM 19864 / JCM 16511 / NBRC 101810 / Mat9-16) TaxID=945713 RepID=I0AP52_IGNAJ|nr:GNAT family N-acetyltransferase [Ignavibacterium album]AFH50759.1 Putative acetyltransferase [Ignavibacterium album JCM 16511]